MKKNFLYITLLLCTTILCAKAQIRFTAGVGCDIYGSKYIVDDNLSDIDLNDFHKVSVSLAPKLLVGVDVSKRVRILTGFGTFTRSDQFDFNDAPSSFSAEPGNLLSKNKYNTIPVLVLFNFLSKESNSRLPIGFGIDFTSFRQTDISSDNLSALGAESLPISRKYNELKDVIDKNMNAVSFQIGYGYEITEHIGIDAVLFARYDLSDFNKLDALYDRYAFAGLNIMAMYKF